MPLTAEQSYALGTKEGRDRINQQLRANPQYAAFLQSIGVNPGGRLSDRQRQLAAEWVRTNVGPIGGLEVDPSGNLNNPQGFGTQMKRWGLPVAAGATMAFGVPGLFPGLMNGALSGGGAAASGGAAAGSAESGVLPSASIAGMHEAVPASIASQGVSGAVGTAMPAVNAIEAAGAGAAGARAADAAGGGASSILKKLATPENGAALAALIAGLASGRTDTQSSDELRRINAITETQMRRADPLHQVAVNLAFGRMPVQYRQGVQVKNMPLPEYTDG